MSRKTHGDIAALEYHGPPGMGFADIVEEFDIASQGLATQVRRLTWDGDDIAMIDRECVRIALGWLAPERKDRPHYLVLAVGAPPRRKGRCDGFDQGAYGVLLDRALQRVGSYLPYDAILRGPASQAVGTALLDRTFDLLSATAPRLGPEDIAAAQRKRAAAREGDWQRDAVTPEALPAIVSQPLRLAVVTLGLTLFLQAPPVGAALLTYTALREAQPLISG